MTADIIAHQSSVERERLLLPQIYNFLHLAAMYATNFMTIIFATLITADTLSGEIVSGTIQVTVAKPIFRWQVVIGKWLGNSLLLALYFLLLAGGTVVGIWAQTGYTAPNLGQGLLLLYLNGLLVMTVTLALSASISTLATGGAVFGLFGIAFIGGWIERIGNVFNNQTAMNVGIVSSLIMPCEVIWNLASNLMTNKLANAFGATPFSFAHNTQSTDDWLYIFIPGWFPWICAE